MINGFANSQPSHDGDSPRARFTTPKTKVILYVGRQHGGESLAYVGREGWDAMRQLSMSACTQEHTEAEIAEALASDLEGGIDACAGAGELECHFYCDQTVAVEADGGAVRIDGVLIA